MGLKGRFADAFGTPQPHLSSMIAEVFALLFVASVALAQGPLKPTYLGGDVVLTSPVHVFDLQNCGTTVSSYTWTTKDANGAVVQSNTATQSIPPGHSYTSANGWKSQFTNAQVANHPYPWTFEVCVSGVCNSCSVPCYSTAAGSCNPYGYGLFNNHRAVSLPNLC